MENKIKCIAIIGLGLIGGSIAKALKGKNYTIVGIDKNKETLKLAKKEKVIKKGFTKLSYQAFKNIDIVFIATPLNLIPYYLNKIAKLNLKKGTIITDVGSTKITICTLAKKLFNTYHLPLTTCHCFTGGHPMAGTEKAGYKHSNKNLFKNNPWVLTPTSKSKKTKKALSKLTNIIKKTGARTVLTTPKDHDKAAAVISHLPLLVAIGLCKTVKNLKDKKIKSLAIKMTSSGFRDTTRLARGNKEMNSNMLTANLKEVKNQLINFTKVTNCFINSL